MPQWWCGFDLVGLGANGSLLFCIGGASTTVLMGLDSVVDGSGGTVVCWWVLVVGLLNGSQWCFSAEVGGSAHGSHSGFGFVILVGCFSFSFSGCWWWWGCGFGFVILVGCFSFSACWWWWGCVFRFCDFGGWGLWWLLKYQSKLQSCPSQDVQSCKSFMLVSCVLLCYMQFTFTVIWLFNSSRACHMS